MDTKTLVKWGVSALLVLILVGAIGGFLADPFGWRKAHLHKVEAQAATATGEAAVSSGQAKAAADAAAIVDRSTIRERDIERIHEVTRENILSQPGADQPLDPRLVGAARRGLCQYLVAYRDDPACVELRASDPAVVPGAGPSGSADPP
jgi:hypothetical protein